ncbi:hypothetical protein H4R33_004902 [Dimargaris cristalligena]|uniref:P-loop containing nucleoside triphosphate hydrolase protein n=1 Tax=Dimargaris cristalligena TaxID=215637 RepID=A0A4Q0A462_9FUNG|nr:hypothetical protein H4R33_004902 [Dimargaris cristalligena]RKP40192.1 P-loop containing nucleoside triphosphate hydrolase protein [Dimargaris cristalligena]|eukprot:RKP40192.1 P-loop containing nucleoside triphosphate hydrolase protein [Dimargaris cristalligena]
MGTPAPSIAGQSFGAPSNQGGGQQSSTDTVYETAIANLQKIYRKKLKPLETTYNFEAFHSAPLSDMDIEAKPMVLLLGQYSTGKTSFVEYLLRQPYPGAHIGIEPTTDRFIAITSGPEPKVIPGHAAAVSGDMPFQGLQKYGNAFLSRFQVSQMPHPLLQSMTIVDSPGVLSGEKQRIQRGYDFPAVIEWFAARANMILVLFDGHKLDISDELKSAIGALHGQEDKVRIVLNKCDQVSGQELMRVYGALMWSLGKVVHSPEVMKVCLGSFWIEPPQHRYDDCRTLLEAEQNDLLRELTELPQSAAIRKINEIVKRARLARVHALIIGHLRGSMPNMFGKKKKQAALLDNLPDEFKKIQIQYNLAPGDFPDPQKFKEKLQLYKLENFSKMNTKLIESVDEALSRDFLQLMQLFPTATSHNVSHSFTGGAPLKTDYSGLG